MLVKILGAIDLASAFAFLMLAFGLSPFFQFIIFCSALLFIKGLFVFTGNILSAVDIFSSLILLFSIFFALPALLLWIPALLLLAKGFVSFM